jgi:hypothetical protein
MGHKYEQTCEGCGYSVAASGGMQSGMNIMTVTIVCRSCKKLYDVLHCHHGFRGGKKGGPYPPECPKKKGHQVEKWESGGPCPKCGAAMVQGGIAALWD